MKKKAPKSAKRKRVVLTRRPAHSGAALNGDLRDRLIRAASDVFEERGYIKASTLEIARRAHASKRDLYAIFENKQALLAACVAMRSARMRRPLEFSVPETGEALEEMLQNFGSTVLREACQPRVIKVYRLALSETGASPEISRMLDANGRAINRAALARLLEQAQKMGAIGKGDPPAMVSQFFALLWEDLLVNLLLGLSDFPKSEEINRRAHQATRALLTLYPPSALQTT